MQSVGGRNIEHAGSHPKQRRRPTRPSISPTPRLSHHGTSMSTSFVWGTSGAQPVEMAAYVLEVLEAWDHFSRLVPDPERCVSHLSERSRIPFYAIGHLREVRNLCAHPDEAGWPSFLDIYQAFKTAGELRRRLDG
jgi:hypothetical protein